MKRRADLARLVADLLDRRPRPSTLRLVLWVAVNAPDGTGKMPARRALDILGGSLESVTAAFEEAQQGGWLEATTWVNSREFTLAWEWCASRPAASDNSHFVTDSVTLPPLGSPAETVTESVTLSAPTVTDSVTLSEIVTDSVTETHFVTDSVTVQGRSVTESVTVRGETVTDSVTPACGTPDALRACDSPYPLPLIGSSHVGSLEESPPVLRTAPLLPKAAKAAANHLEDFERFWRIAPRRVNKSVAREVWVRDVRRADVDDVIQAALLWAQRCDGQDPQFIAHPATWLRKGRWRDEFENAKEAAQSALTPARKESSNGFKTRADINAERRREQLDLVRRGGPLPGDVRDSGPGAALLGPGPARDGGVFLDRQRVGAGVGARAERTPGRVVHPGDGGAVGPRSPDTERDPRGVA